MENILYNIIFFPFITAFFISAFATPICIKLLKKFKIMDDPSVRKHPGIIHTKPIPRGGGIPFFIGIFLAGIIFLPFNKIVGSVFLASFVALITGVLDDKYDISPYVRFGLNIVCALIVVSAGISVLYITNPFGGILYLSDYKLVFEILGINGAIVLSDIVAVIWIVWVMNMLNWSKGVDGQMPGIVAISAIFIGLLSLRFGYLDSFSQISSIFSFLIAGSALGFLIYNFYPARIFPGYGATAIYLVLSVAAILSGAKLATAILVMGVPLADGAFTIGRRIITGHSPFWHDKKHLHHLLLSSGLGQRSVALFYWSISAILGSLSLVLSSKGKAFAIIMVGIIVGGALLFLNYLIRKKNGE